MRNFDGLICEKASKEGLKNLTHHCNATFILKEENQVFRDSTENKLEEFSEKIQYLNDLVVSSAKSVNKEMFGAVRKAVGQL
jgi:septation ring formation regulator EzrA